MEPDFMIMIIIIIIIYMYILDIWTYICIFMYMQTWKQCALPVITTMAMWQLIHLVTWCTVTHYALCLGCWALFGSLVSAMCNRTSCAQGHELPHSHCGDNREGTLFSWLHIFYAHLTSVRFEYAVYNGSLMT